MNRIKVYVVGYSYGYARWINVPFDIVDSADDADIIIFTGGEDVNPKLYGEPKGRFTYFSNRCVREKNEWDYITGLNKKHVIVGICRGLQFMNVMAGGKMIQDVSGHAGGPHDILFPQTGEIMKTSSLHHQMVYPFNISKEEYEIIAYSRVNRSKWYLNGYNEGINLPANFVEPEVVWYPGFNAIGVQGHPEMMLKGEPLVVWLNNFVIQKLEQ